MPNLELRIANLDEEEEKEEEEQELTLDLIYEDGCIKIEED